MQTAHRNHFGTETCACLDTSGVASLSTMKIVSGHTPALFQGIKKQPLSGCSTMVAGGGDEEGRRHSSAVIVSERACTGE